MTVVEMGGCDFGSNCFKSMVEIGLFFRQAKRQSGREEKNKTYREKER